MTDEHPVPTPMPTDPLMEAVRLARPYVATAATGVGARGDDARAALERIDALTTTAAVRARPL